MGFPNTIHPSRNTIRIFLLDKKVDKMNQLQRDIKTVLNIIKGNTVDMNEHEAIKRLYWYVEQDLEY